MAAPDRLLFAALAMIAATAACATVREPKAEGRPLPPPQTAAAPPAGETTPPPTVPADERAGGVAPAQRPAPEPTLIVIDPVPAEEVRAPSLAEAAARERARRRTESAPPVLVVNNENLAQHAAGGVLTIAHSTPEEEAAADAEIEDAAEREKHWRERGLEIRKRWREAVDRVPELEAKVAELRQLFYATDDPAVRDGRVKPEWDKAIADLEQARYQAERGGEEVAAFLDEGRRAGALPGWLREGAELEPEPVVEQVEGIADHEPSEPEIYEPPPGR